MKLIITIKAIITIVFITLPFKKVVLAFTPLAITRREKNRICIICHYNNNDNNNRNAKSDLDNEESEYNESSNINPQSSSNMFQDDECYDLCDDNNNDHDKLQMKQNIVNDEEVVSMSTTNNKKNDLTPTKQTWQNLELHWSIDESTNDCDVDDITSCSEPCLDCRGEGRKLCSFCNGVGYVDFGFAEKGTVGERLVNNMMDKTKNNNGNDDVNGNGRLGVECPVCNEDGEQSCPTCRGSGWIARWRLNNIHNISDLRP